MFTFMKEISHIIIVTLLIIEGVKAIVHIRETRKKRETERKYSQKLIKIWKGAIVQKISDMRSLGDLVNHGAEKEEILIRVKKMIGELNDTMYSLKLFSSDEPTEMLQAISYLNSRGDEGLETLRDFLELRIRDFETEKKRQKTISKFLKKHSPN